MIEAQVQVEPKQRIIEAEKKEKEKERERKMIGIQFHIQSCYWINLAEIAVNVDIIAMDAI